jgi:hypothetical protein
MRWRASVGVGCVGVGLARQMCANRPTERPCWSGTNGRTWRWPFLLVTAQVPESSRASLAQGRATITTDRTVHAQSICAGLSSCSACQTHELCKSQELATTAANLAPGALRAHRVVLADLGLDIGHVEQPTAVTTEHPLLMATVVVDEAPQLAPRHDVADAPHAHPSADLEQVACHA